MPADTQLTSLDLHATGLFCTQVTADPFFRFATGTQPVFAGVRRWHADFPVPISIDINTTEWIPLQWGHLVVRLVVAIARSTLVRLKGQMKYNLVYSASNDTEMVEMV